MDEIVKSDGARGGKSEPSAPDNARRSGPGGLAELMPRAQLSHLGVWVQGVEYLGAAYEGIWRVIKRLLLSSEGSATRFSFVAPARFEEEIEEFFANLPDDVRPRVRLLPFGARSDEHDDAEADRQAAFANHLDVDAWLVPNPMWGGSKHLVRPKLVWFHDFLLADFPQSYPRELFTQFKSTVRELSDAGSFFIFTSPYVREKHGREVCGIQPEQSMLIVNPPIDDTEGLADFSPEEGGEYIRSELEQNLTKWCSPLHAEIFSHHISHYPFEKVPYLFVSSQNREHKGFLRFAQAHAALVREHYVPYSVFTTALVDANGQTPLEQFLRKQLLLGDFMSVGKVSDVTHALLYKFARMTIHPSTFEGNLPLPFAESVAVGTPCLMPFSRAFEDFVDPAMHPWVFYNPAPSSLIAKIKEVDANYAEFLAAQQQVLGSLRRNDLQNFFRLHVEAARRAADLQVRSTRRARVTLQVRMWPEFELATSPRAKPDGRTAMHWAQYLDADQAPGTAYFIVSVSGDVPDPADLKLAVEIGAWDDDGYFVADCQPFAFEKGGVLPRALRNALELSGTSQSYSALDERVGWTKLVWSGGRSPEVRISAIEQPAGAKVTLRLGCVTGLERDVTTPTSGRVAEKKDA